MIFAQAESTNFNVIDYNRQELKSFCLLLFLT